MSFVSRSERVSESPSSPGIMMSSTTRSMSAACIAFRAAAADSATLARSPCLVRKRARRSRMSRWSSTTRMCGVRSMRGELTRGFPRRFGKSVTDCRQSSCRRQEWRQRRPFADENSATSARQVSRSSNEQPRRHRLMRQSVKIALADDARLPSAADLFLVSAELCRARFRPWPMGMMGMMGIRPRPRDAQERRHQQRRRALAGGDQQPRSMRRFTQFDADKNGNLSLAEFEALWAEITKPVAVRAFQFLDPDGDAAIAKAELDERFGTVGQPLRPERRRHALAARSPASARLDGHRGRGGDNRRRRPGAKSRPQESPEGRVSRPRDPRPPARMEAPERPLRGFRANQLCPRTLWKRWL